jgi:hypothetical protein
MRPVHIAALACLLSCAATPAASAAAIEKLPPSVPAFDDDFVLQGEYVGSIKSTTGTSERIGLQVVARGNGQFQAVEYAGGLPGNGGAMENRRKYSGAKSSGAVELAGDDRRISIERDWASVRDASGRELGRLAKHHRLSQTLLAPPPREATVLFRGTHADRFTAGIVTADKLLNVGADTVQDYGDFSMHLEFRTPYMPAARGQARGNSGVYIQGRYELQILDSFGLDGLNNECGGIYTQQRPLINMCLPPLSWQTYDIDFIAAKFDAGGKKISPARITARHNGIVIHDDYEISSKTGQGAPEGPDPRPIKLQDHGNPVHFRNIWVVERKTASGPLPSLRMTPASGPAAPCLPGLAQGATFDLSVRSTDPFALSSRAGR